jgi:hypothetical protein
MIRFRHPGLDKTPNLAFGTSEFLHDFRDVNRVVGSFIFHRQTDTDMVLKTRYSSLPSRPPSPAVKYVLEVPWCGHEPVFTHDPHQYGFSNT